jgi:hypothetical protein
MRSSLLTLNDMSRSAIHCLSPEDWGQDPYMGSRGAIQPGCGSFVAANTTRTTEWESLRTIWEAERAGQSIITKPSDQQRVISQKSRWRKTIWHSADEGIKPSYSKGGRVT